MKKEQEKLEHESLLVRNGSEVGLGGGASRGDGGEAPAGWAPGWGDGK